MEYGSETIDMAEELKVNHNLDVKVNADEAVKLDFSRADLLKNTSWGYTEDRDMTARKEELVKSLNAGDSFAERLKFTYSESSWLVDREIPKKAEIDKKMNDANKTFGFGELSDSQKSKRGKKFRVKAERQAAIIKEMKKHYGGRKAALEAVMSDVLPAAIYERRNDEEALNSYMADTSHLDNTGEMMSDIAFYYVWQSYAKDGSSAKQFIGQLPKRKDVKGMGNLVDSKKYKDEYVNILLEMEKLDVDLFNYDSDEEFIKDYSCKLAALRMYSHGDTMLKKVGNDPRIKGKAEMLLAKTKLIQDMISDYQNRALLIQSPYYVLLAGKNMDSLSEKDLKKRYKATNDLVAKEYIQLFLNRKIGLNFKKGVKASELLPKAEKKTKAELKEERIKKHDIDVSKMKFREELLDTYRKDIKKQYKKISDEDVNSIALRRYAEDQADPYRSLYEYQCGLVLNKGDENMKEYYTIEDEHPGFSFEEKVYSEKPFLELGKDISENEISAIHNLSITLTEICKKKIGELSESAKIEIKKYFDTLVKLASYKKKYELVTGLDKDWAENAPDENDEFSESDKRKRLKMTASVQKYVQSIKDDWYYQGLCTSMVRDAQNIRDMISKLFPLEADNMLKGSVVRESLLSEKAVKERNRVMYKGTPAEAEKKMPEIFPVEFAKKENEFLTGEKIGKKELAALKSKYEQSYTDIEKCREVYKKCYEKKAKFQNTFADIDGIENFTEELVWAEVLPKEKQRDFLVALAEVRKGNLDKNAVNTVRDGLKNVLNYFAKMDTYDIDSMDTRDKFFEDYEKKRRDTELGETVSSVINLYIGLGGKLKENTLAALNERKRYYAGLSEWFINSTMLAIDPESMVLDINKLNEMSVDKLQLVVDEEKNKLQELDSEIKTISEEIYDEEVKELLGKKSISGKEFEKLKLKLADLELKRTDSYRRCRYILRFLCERKRSVRRMSERLSRGSALVKGISNKKLDRYGYATKSMVMLREDADEIVNKSNGFLCAVKYDEKGDYAEIRPSLPEFVTDQKSNKQYPLRLAYNLLIKGVVRYMVNEKGNCKVDSKKIGDLDYAIHCKEYKEVFDIIGPEIESDLKKQKWSKADIIAALNNLKGGFFADETYLALEYYGKKLESYEYESEYRIKEREKLEKKLKDNPDKREELESQIETMKKALEIQNAKIEHEKVIFAEIRDMDVTRKDIPIPNQCSGNGTFIYNVKESIMNDLKITEPERPIRRHLIQDMLANPGEAEKLLKDVRKNLPVLKSKCGLKLEENEIEGYLRELSEGKVFNKETINSITEKLSVVRKYDYHEAAVIAEYDGKIITTEGFAPDVTEILSAPFSLHGAIGIYYGERNGGSHTGFDGFYENDSPIVSTDLELELYDIQESAKSEKHKPKKKK